MSDDQLLANLKDWLDKIDAHRDHEAERLRQGRREAIQAMRDAGWSLERIGASVGRKKQTITQWLRGGPTS